MATDGQLLSRPTEAADTAAAVSTFWTNIQIFSKID